MYYNQNTAFSHKGKCVPFSFLEKDGNELGEGVPVAFIITNREDKIMLAKAFAAIKERVGEIVGAVLMTDSAEQYYNAWIEVFGPIQKLLCAWHVDRAWRISLKRRVKDVTVQNKLYQMLITLKNEPNEATFDLVMQHILDFTSQLEDTLRLAQYFNTFYAPRKDSEQHVTVKAVYKYQHVRRELSQTIQTYNTGGTIQPTRSTR